jgi:hypothetical protein
MVGILHHGGCQHVEKRHQSYNAQTTIAKSLRNGLGI